MYTRFADIYDALTHDIHYSRWADYLQSVFLKFGVEPKLILNWDVVQEAWQLNFQSETMKLLLGFLLICSQGHIIKH